MTVGRALALTCVLSLGLAARLTAQCPDGSSPPCRGTAAAPPFIAVLPFASRSTDTLDAYLAATLTEDVTAELTRTRAVRVLSARGRPAADYTLSGSVRRAGDGLHAVMQLQRRTGEVVWTARIERARREAALVPRDVAEQLLRALGRQPRPTTPPPRNRTRLVDPLAYDLYLRGRYQLGRRTEASVARAASLFSDAIARDSTFALGWAGLARTLQFANIWGLAIPGIPRASLVAREVAASERAIELDSTDVGIWLMRARVALDLDPTSRTPTIRAVGRALALDSLSAESWHELGLALEETSRPDEAAAAWRRAIALDPASVLALSFYALHFSLARQVDSARAWADSALAIDPGFFVAQGVAGLTALAQGRLDDAEAHYVAARRIGSGPEAVIAITGLALVALARGDTIGARALIADAESSTDATAPHRHAAVDLAATYAALGEPDRALWWLERYRPRRDLHYQLHLRRDFQLDPLRADPRFQRLIEESRPR
jgi:TolB-like protein